MPEQHTKEISEDQRVIYLEGAFTFPSNKQKTFISYSKQWQEYFSPVSTSSWNSELLLYVYIGYMGLRTLKGF